MKKTMNLQSFKRFWKMIKPEHPIFYGLMICSLIGNLLIVAMTYIMAIGIDNLLEAIKRVGLKGMTLSLVEEALLGPVLLLILFSIISSITSFIQERAMASLSERVTLRIRKEVTKKFKTLPMAFFDNHQVGDIISRSTTGLNQLSQVLLTGINQFFTSVVTILFAGIMLFYIDAKLTILVLLLIGGSTFMTTKIANKNKVFADQSQAELGQLNNKMEEYLAGNLVTKTFNQQQNAEKTIDAVNQQHYRAFKKAQFLNFAIYPAIRFINQLAFIISAILGAMLVLSGGITIGFLQAYLQYINQISEPISTASYVINSIQAAMASIDRIFVILDEADEQPEATHLETISSPKGAIEFKNVQFGYTPEKILMKNVDFSVQPKKTVAIVGPTGAGKTTLVNLLMRFYEINQGAITFDGIDITKLSRQNLRNLFGMVLQNTWLFEGTVADNIAYGKKDASREEIIEAAKIAQCDHFIRTLPQGYDTIISSENGALSQGQQQLLTIARIILANPPVVILDEATSSVDTRTEAHIQKAMETVTENRTSFVIAHRLSTIENADLILVMKNGDIIEKGTHQELLQAPTLYASLYNSQFQTT
ncbi:TPA: ABC transporter ATP-binding protein [Enterococcus faecalis]|uniref:ABC transporter, ATP-binding protein n=2 Tax=Enterococcus faecalis TaxID=1351 RepID=A0ABC9TNZ9_ENTFL|nr:MULTISPECIES: ABC transporter ATP-binding protein [Enterococcus]ETJ09354.1 MAG: putative beta-glucan-transporting ATPase [Enterococcus faecalis DORA_14]HAP3746041.1 ABC transporter ATP-binding protein [Enterococcus faecalis TDR28]HAP3752019.1 ABC transporter ATP-binding protein [Enterococcus faecalis TDR22]HAP3754815.1 ABC transporter ATP-binding protein [Enterococcus faecalis TDR13]HAP3758035.1 ABC transporter ATP-binding protein [Enterococcus faecalis TDR7]HAP3769212.1 ABC transporter AT